MSEGDLFESLDYLDDDSVSDEFSEGEDDEELDQELGESDDSHVKILTDAEMEFLADVAVDTPKPEEPKGPTRATRTTNRLEKTRTTFICVNEDAFKSQLLKEQQKSVDSLPISTGPTRAARSRDAVRTTFICLNEEAFSAQLKKEADIQEEKSEPPKPSVNEPPAVPSRPPPRPDRPSRPDRPPRPLKKDSQQSQSQLNFPRFGNAPPARPAGRRASINPTISDKPISMPPAYIELIQTEKDYIGKLELITRVFLKEIREKQLLNSYETVSLFSNIEDLIPINKKLLEELSNLENQSSKAVGEVFQKNARNFKTYGVYCSNQPNIHELLTEYKEENKEFSEFLKKCFKLPECKKQDLESFLMMPLQRLCRYPLLLKELVSYENFTLKKTGPAESGEHGICICGGGDPDIKRVDIDQHWVGISCGGVHYAGVSLGKSVYVWGKGREGQLGLGKDVSQRDSPTLLPLYSDSNQPIPASKVICGPLQTAIIAESRDLYVCGILPNGPTFKPTLLLFDGKKRSVKSVSFGVRCFYIIVEHQSDPSETEVWVWGRSNKGQLGLGKDITSVDVPTKIHELNGKNIIQISCGETHVACLSEHGAVFIWGDNTNNILGLGALTDTSKPQLFMPLLGKNIVQLECGYEHTFARSATGSIYSWGSGRHGVLGRGESVDVGKLDIIHSLENKSVESIVSGGMHAFVVSNGGKTYSWGEGKMFKTCHGSVEDILEPTIVKGLSGYIVKEVACGANGSVAYYEKFSETQSSIVNLHAGMEDFKAVVTEINDQVRKVENITSLLKVANQIENGQKLNIVNQSRSKIVEGSMKVNGKSRYAFLFSDIIIICRLPSKNDPNKKYKAVKRLLLSECAHADLPDTPHEGRHRFEIQHNSENVYIIKMRKKDRKELWMKYLSDCGLVTKQRLSKPAPKPAPQKTTKSKSSNPKLDSKKTSNTLSPVVPNNKAMRRKSTRTIPKQDSNDVENDAISFLIAKLEKELREETQARTIVEKQNEALKTLVKDQKKIASDNLLDEESIKETSKRLESVSSLVDKLTEENITLTNQVKSKRTELISLRKANGKSIDDIYELDEDSDEEDSEEDDE